MRVLRVRGQAIESAVLYKVSGENVEAPWCLQPRNGPDNRPSLSHPETQPESSLHENATGQDFEKGLDLRWRKKTSSYRMYIV
jgi:hypothetical protein